MAICGTGLELWMELTADKPRMVFELNDLYQSLVWGKTAQNHSLSTKDFTVTIIKFITMSMALGDLLAAIEFKGQGTFLKDAGIAPKPHSASLFLNLPLRVHQVNDRMGSMFIKLAGVGVCEPTDIACKLRYRHLHPQTYS